MTHFNNSYKNPVHSCTYSPKTGEWVCKGTIGTLTYPAVGEGRMTRREACNAYRDQAHGITGILDAAFGANW